MATWRETQGLDRIVIIFSALFLSTVLWAWNVSDISYSLLGLLGAFLLFTHRVTFQFNREEAGLFVTVLFFVLVAFFSLWANGMPASGLRYLRRISDEFLWLAPIFFTFRARRISELLIWLMFGLATIVAGLIALHDIGLPGVPDFSRRAAGTTHPNIFGGISLALTCLTITSMNFFWRRSIFATIFMLFSTLMGITAVLFSGSRGAWVAMLVLMFISLICYWHRFRRSIRMLAVLTLVVIPIVGYQIPMVQQRMQQAIDQTEIYFKGTGGVANQDTAVGGRFEIWAAAWKMFEENPWFGVGLNQYKATAKRFVQEGQWESSINSIDIHPHAHNEILDALATRGVFGFLALSLLFGDPLLIFHRRIGADHSHTSRLGCAGLLLVVAYVSCGITDVSLHFEEQIVVYLFSISVLFGRIRQHELLTKAQTST